MDAVAAAAEREKPATAVGLIGKDSALFVACRERELE